MSATPTTQRTWAQTALIWLRGDSFPIRVVREASLFTFIYFAYRLGQGFVADQYPQAEANAYWLIGVERSLGLFVEQGWQAFMLQSGMWMDVFVWYYENMHFPVTLGVMMWAFWKAGARYRIIRNTWALFTIGAFLVQWAWPLMPPRLLPSFGFVDMSAQTGIYSADQLGPLTNQIAAMPSIHFGWSAFVAATILYVRRHWTSWIALVHPALTFIAIVVTANHFILDAVASVPILFGAFLVARTPRFNAWLDHVRRRDRLPYEREDEAAILRLRDSALQFWERHMTTLRGMMLWSAGIVVIVLAWTWNWFDVDEFVNLQQAQAVLAGQVPYVDFAAHHPPVYVALLSLVAWLPGSPLVWARLLSAAFVWGAGILVAHIYLRSGREGAAWRFLLLYCASALIVIGGTRAMNETPVLFFLALAAWCGTHPRLDDHRAGLLTGALLAVAFLTRFTTVFFAVPFLWLPAARLRWAMVGGAGALLATGLVAWWISPGFVAEFWGDTIVYQRAREPLLRPISTGLAILGSGLLVAVAVWRMVPGLRPSRGRYQAAFAAAMVGALALAFLPRVYPHYYIPFLPILAAFVVEVWRQPKLGQTARQSAVGMFLVSAMLLSMIYVDSTPHHELDEAQAVAATLAAVAPSDLPVLTDAPEYAVLADRTNYGGYFWNLADDWSDFEFAKGLARSSVVIDAPRDHSFPADVEQRLATMPCLAVHDVRLYWTGTAGAPPAPFAPSC